MLPAAWRDDDCDVPGVDDGNGDLVTRAARQLDALRRAVADSGDKSGRGLLATVELAWTEWGRRVETMEASGRQFETDRHAAAEAWRQAEAMLSLATNSIVASSLHLRGVPSPARRRRRLVTAPTHASPAAASAPLPAPVDDACGTIADPQYRFVPDHALTAFMFGRFQVFTRGGVIDTWHGVKPQTVLRYLVARPGRQAPRDVLVDQLWPDADPEVGRRNLHQVVYTLRRALRAVDGGMSDAIVHEHDSYRLAEHLDLWVDVAEFERRVGAARRLVESGDSVGALAECVRAEQLYVDDYLTDALYEEWTAVERERLRVMSVELTERLNSLLFDQRRFNEMVAICQRRLRIDATAEGAHRWMMRAYAGLGQRDLATQQYRYCTEALQRTWGVPPTPETERVYRSLLA